MLENIKVGKKITGGFVVVLAILLLVGIVGYAAINKASKGFAQYRDWAKDANLVGMVQANILMCRMNVKDYMQSASQKDIDEFNEYVQKTDELITDVEKEIQNPERSKLVKQVVDNFKDYKAAFPQVVKLMQQRDQITNGVLRTDGPLAERTLNEIMEATENDGFAELTFIASQAMRHLLLARIYGTQFLDTNSDDAAKRVRQELGLVQQQLDNLSRELKSTTMKNKLNIVQNSVNNYKNSFDELVIAINDRNEIIAGTLDRLGPVFAKDIDDVKLSIKTAQDELGPKLQRSNRNSVLVIILVVILALAIGSSLSLIITKGIIGPVNKINEIANFISRGDLSKEIDIYQKDEIGMLAHAFRNIKEAVQNLINEAAMLTKAAVEGKLDVRGDANKFQGEYRNIVQGVNDTLDAVIGPLNVSAEYIDRISKGDIPARITDEYKGDFNEIKNNLNMCIDAVNGLVAESAMLTEAAVNGKLDVRGDAKKFHGDYRNIVQGVNDTLDAVIGPLNVSAEYIDRISKGDIPAKITDEYRGDFNEIKNNLNMCIDAVNGLVAESAMLTEAAVNGKLDVRGDAKKFHGDYRNIVQGVNDTLDAVIGPLNVSAEYIDRISKGDIPAKITDEYRGDFNEIKNNLNMCIDAVNGLVAESAMLTEAAVNGKLDVRGDAKKFHGDYRNIVQGVNDTLDAVIGPLNVSAEYIDRISKGDIPAKITDEYKGDFNEIKNNLNMCIDAVNGLSREMITLVQASIKGELDIRGDASKFSGDYAKIVQGVNTTVETLVGHLDNVPTPVMIINNDYQIQYMNTAGAKLLGTSAASLKGKKCYEQFKTSDCNTQKCACARAMSTNQKADSETDAHPNGMNLEISYSGVSIKDLDGKTIGALEVISDQTAVKKAARVAEKVNKYQDVAVSKLNQNLEKVSKGDLNLDYKLPAADEDTRENERSFTEINSALQTTSKAINELIAEAKMLTEAAVNGQLDTRGKTDKFLGEYRNIVQGVNDTLDAVVIPMKEAAAVMAKIADKDVTARVTGNYKGQLDDFKNDINIAATNLDEALQNIATSVEQVAAASNQVAKGSQQLAEGSNEQASAIEEVSSSLEEMSSMTQQNSDNANQAKTLAESAQKAAIDGKNNMDQMSAAILKIKESSDETSKIVKTIDEIAFQTNLLALNAAVEAARAGEAGKGFAVVAEEVRNLAQRSAEAAKNTAQLIEESVENADQGVKITKVAADGLNSIVESVKKTNDLISEIAAASKEQAVGIDQVSTAVQQMNKVTQDNASNSEESASAAEEMSSQAVSMQSQVGEFRLSKTISVGHVRQIAPKSHGIEKRKPAPVVQKKKSQVIKADEVIPLDDDDFDDF